MSFCLHLVSFACFLASGYALHPSRNKQMLAHIKPKKTMKDDFKNQPYKIPILFLPVKLMFFLCM